MDLVALTSFLFFLHLSFSPVAWAHQFAWDQFFKSLGPGQMNTGDIFWSSQILFSILIILLSEDLNPFQMCLFSLQDSCTTKWGLRRRLRTAHTGNRGSEGRLAYGFIYRFGAFTKAHYITWTSTKSSQNLIATADFELKCTLDFWGNSFYDPGVILCFRTSRVVHFYSILYNQRWYQHSAVVWLHNRHIGPVGDRIKTWPLYW